MAKRRSCALLPKKGISLFSKLKSEFGYKTARDIFTRVITPKFITDFKGTLILDDEGIPSYDSVMSIPVVKDFVGEAKVLNSLNKGYKVQPNTRASYEEALRQAKTFNDQSSHNKDYVATVKNTEGGIKVEIVKRTEESAKDFASQYSSMALSHKLEEMFRPLGLTVGMLTGEETPSGIVGVTSFSRIRDIANGFSSIIRVANNMAGSLAIPEEFAHLLVRMFYDSTLVQRGLNALKNSPEAIKQILGDKYENYRTRYQDNTDRLAEEALGHVLQDKLLGNYSPVTLSLFDRIKQWLINQFKGFKSNVVDSAIYEAETSMSTIAKNILSNPESITRDKLEKINTDTELNALSEEVDKKLALLNKIIQTEAKREQIGSKDITLNIESIKKALGENGNRDLGIFQYLYHVLEQLKALSSSLDTIDTTDIKSVFKFLRAVRMYMKSYDAILQDLNDIIIDGEFDVTSSYDVPGEDNPVSIEELVQRVSSVSTRLQRRWVKASNVYLKNFLSDYYDSNTTINGQRISLEDLLAKCPSDISFSERWLDALSDSADPLLQTIDMVVKEATAKVRDRHMKESRKIIALRQEMEDAGITNTEWMYEKDADGNLTGNYVSEIDWPAFYKARKEFLDYLDKKYGNSTIGIQAKERNAELTAWNIANTGSVFGFRPLLSKYGSKAYSSLSAKQKEILKKGLELKEAYDKLYPEDRVRGRKAIQIRRTSAQRALDTITSPSKAWEAVKEALSESWQRSTADEEEFGTTTGLRDFEGKEFFALPVLYTNRLSNANELSTDFFSSLLQYSYATLRYDEFSQVVDPLEVAKTWINENRITTKTRGGKVLQEVVKTGKEALKLEVQESSTNISQRLEDYYASQLYGRMLKEGTEVAGINTNKIATKLLDWTAMASLSFNWLAQIANVFNGIAMQNVEVAARQFFTPGDLLKADTFYAKHLKDLFANLGARNSYDTLSLIGEFFNIKQDYENRARGTQNKNLIHRALGASISFIGQEAGDHWLYYRTALAVLNNTIVKVPNKGTMSLLEALQTRNVTGGHGIKEMYLPEGTTLEDGSVVDVHAIGRKIAKINHGLFGIYNTEDSNAAHRTAVGRLALQFRKWMKPLLNKRFQKRQYNASLQAEEEGWYVTCVRFLRELHKCKYSIPAVWQYLEEFEKKNIIRALTDSIQVLLLSLLTGVIDWPDDEDTPRSWKFAELISRRLSTEIRALHPIGIFDESRKLFKSPFPALKTINSCYDILASLITPEDWTEELSSGPYKGMTRLEKNLYKAPVWGLVHYRQFSKAVGDVDEIINYYARPY